ncbi:unnamed protein product [Spirodela intermedia]|uniref:Uncharacterized protein n=1 Tax=Spirodela intermedia TaxID=51605 RepID=A0A7I8IFU9_SPIIN|nr:unnamed protein product [Spirodela intermedia]CAA6656762.1 unnamed protein product [Spirodela intermedia]
MPSPVYQCRKAFLLNIAVNCSLTRRNISWIEVEFPMKVDAIFNPVGGFLRLLADNIENGVNELCALRVMPLRPVVARSGLSEDEVIHEDRPGNVSPTAGLIVIHVNSLELQLVVSVVPPGRVDPVLGADHFPELGPDLVAALPSLNV